MTKVNFSKKKYQTNKTPIYIYDSRDNDPAIKNCNNQDKNPNKHNTKHTYNRVQTNNSCTCNQLAETHCCYDRPSGQLKM